MKIQYASDLHLELPANEQWLSEQPIVPYGDVLILAGDIAYLGQGFADHPFWDWASANYQQVIVALGNHEFYNHYDLATMHNGMVGKIRHNVYWYYNCVVKLGNVDVIVTTLWAHIMPRNSHFTEYSVTDFHRITFGDHILTSNDFNKVHEHCLEFLKKAISQSTAKHKVVVTHHVPSFQVTTKWFAGHSYIGAFTVDLDELIKNSDVDVWIYGHSHWNIETRIGKTLLTSNQLGYVHRKEHHGFDREKYIEMI